MGAINVMGMQWAHTDGRYHTSARCPHMDRGNIAVDVRDGRVLGAACLACGNQDFTVLVEGKDDFWPVPSFQVIGDEDERGENDDQRGAASQ